MGILQGIMTTQKENNNGYDEIMTENNFIYHNENENINTDGDCYSRIPALQYVLHMPLSPV